MWRWMWWESVETKKVAVSEAAVVEAGEAVGRGRDGGDGDVNCVCVAVAVNEEAMVDEAVAAAMGEG